MKYILLLLILFQAECVWLIKGYEVGPWHWCFNFDQQSAEQYPFCGYDRRDCEVTRKRLLNSPKHTHIVVTSECYFNEEEG